MILRRLPQVHSVAVAAVCRGGVDVVVVLLVLVPTVLLLALPPLLLLFKFLLLLLPLSLLLLVFCSVFATAAVDFVVAGVPSLASTGPMFVLVLVPQALCGTMGRGLP